MDEIVFFSSCKADRRRVGGAFEYGSSTTESSSGAEANNRSLTLRLDIKG
jgi:hypothetical protein